MRYRELGRTGKQVSVVAMGCWAFSGGATWGDQEDKDSIAAVHAALDAGINFFDTAEGYGSGKSEEVLGQALEGRRDEAFVATKVSRNNLAADQVAASCETSLRRLRTDYIDLYQIHWPSRIVPFEETATALQKLVEQGKIGAIAVSNFGVLDLPEFAPLCQVESNQLPYSLIWRAIEFGIVDACLAHGTGILCYSPLAQGLLTGKWATADDVPDGRNRTRLYSASRGAGRHNEEGHEELIFAALKRIREISEGLGEPMANVSIAWLLAQPAVTAVLTGMRNPGQVARNVAAGDLELPADAIAALAEATEALKERMGASPDMFQSESRFR